MPIRRRCASKNLDGGILTPPPAG